MNDPVLSFKNVTFAYPGQDPIFEDLSFDLYPNDRIAITGSSNTGKTTLINLMVGLRLPSSGQIVNNLAYPRKLQKFQSDLFKFDKAPESYFVDQDRIPLDMLDDPIIKNNNEIAWRDSLLYVYATPRDETLSFNDFTRIIHLGPYTNNITADKRYITK